MQEALKYLLLTYNAIALLSMVIALVLWRETRSAYYKLLFKYWVLVLIHFIVQAVVEKTTPLHHGLAFSMIYPLMWLVTDLLTRLGQVPFPKRTFLALALGSYPLMFLFHYLETPPWTVVLPVTLAGDLVPAFVSIQIILHRWRSISAIMKGLTLSILLSCWHNLSYAFAFNVQETLVPGFALAMLFIISLMILAPAAVSEAIAKEKAELELTLKYHMQLMQTAKASALGEMAGGVAHEINNPLQIIQGLSRMIRKNALDEEVDRNDIITRATKIDETTERIAKITAGLIAFSRDGQGRPMGAEPLLPLLEETCSFFRESFFSEGISMDFGPVDPKVEVLCRKVDIQQVLLNLLSNARDAVRPLAEKWIRLETEQKQDRLVIKITDSGLGLPEELMEKIFRPFFTTKDVGLGTGLGLPVAQGLIENNGGRIWYQLHQGHTQFAFELKLA